jgi:hypothetical protein
MGQGDINKLELVLQQRAGVPLEQEDIPLKQESSGAAPLGRAIE